MLSGDQITEVRTIMKHCYMIQVEAEDEKLIDEHIPLVDMVSEYLPMIISSYKHFVEDYSKLREEIYDSRRYQTEEE